MKFIKAIFGYNLYLNLWYSFTIAWLIHLINASKFFAGAEVSYYRWENLLTAEFFEVRLESFIYIFLTAFVFFTVKDQSKDKVR